MKPFIVLLILFFVSSTLFASLPDHTGVAQDSSVSVTVAAATTSVQHVKLNWAQKLFGKLFHKKQRNEVPKQDAMATASSLYGIGGLFSLLLMLVAPVIGVLALPLSIIAIAKGNKALQLGTSNPGSAKAGKTLGTVTIVLSVIAAIAAVIAVASMRSLIGNWTWGG